MSTHSDAGNVNRSLREGTGGGRIDDRANCRLTRTKTVAGSAEDGNERHSPYTSALLQHLDAEEDIAVVLRRVRQSVLKATNSRQEPWEYGSLIGDQLVLSRLAR